MLNGRWFAGRMVLVEYLAPKVRKFLYEHVGIPIPTCGNPDTTCGNPYSVPTCRNAYANIWQSLYQRVDPNMWNLR